MWFRVHVLHHELQAKQPNRHNAFVVPFSSGRTSTQRGEFPTRAACMMSNSGRTHVFATSIDENLRHPQSSSHVRGEWFVVIQEPCHLSGFNSAILLSANIAANSILCDRGHLAQVESWHLGKTLSLIEKKTFHTRHKTSPPRTCM